MSKFLEVYSQTNIINICCQQPGEERPWERGCAVLSGALTAGTFCGITSFVLKNIFLMDQLNWTVWIRNLYILGHLAQLKCTRRTLAELTLATLCRM